MKPQKPTSLPTPPSVRAAPELPTLKKKEEEKKGGGVALTGGSSSGGGGSFLSRWFGVGAQRGASSTMAKSAATTAARSGIGAAGKLGFGPMLVNFLASNMAAVLFTGLITGGAVYTLYSLGMAANAERPGVKKSVFAQSDAVKSAEGVEGRVDASGLSYFQTANTGGAFNEGLKTADAPAAENASDAPAEEPTAPPTAEPIPEGSGPQIADALAKNLEKPKMVAARGMPGGGGLGGGNGLAGGSGLSGGMMKKFDPKAGAIAPSAPMRRDSTAKLTARRVSPIRGAKGGAMQQLKFANSTSRKALGQTSGEGQSFQAAEAFNTAPIDQGAQNVAGAGMGDAGAGTGTGANDDGGPIGRTGEEPAPDTGKSEDKTPYGKQLMMAQALLMAASSIILIIGILAIIKKMPIIGVIAEMWQKILYGAAIGMAASASAIGAMVSQQQGQKDQGMMVTIGGAITTAAATAALMMPGEGSAWVAVLGGIAGIGSSIGAMLLPMMKGGGAGGAGAGAAK